MKRNFLLTLLLTLLPFAGWALPGYQLTGLIDGTNAWVIGSQELPGVEESSDYEVVGYYDSEGFPVSVITEVGWYFAKVEDETGVVEPTYVPFQAWKPISTEFINNAATFNQSVISGALQLYYDEWTSKGTDEEKAAYLAESKSWEIAAAKDADKTVDHKGFPWIVLKSTESVPCRVSFIYNEGEPIYPWNSFHNNDIFFSTTGKTYGVASIEEEYHAGQVWNDPTDDAADENTGDVADYNWDNTKFKAYFTPADLNVPDPNGVRFKTLRKTYNVNVSGVNGPSKVYGDALVLNTSLITTNQNEINENPALMEEIVSKLQIVYDLKYEPVANHKEYILKLAEGVIPTVATKVGNDWEYTYGTDYIDVVSESFEENQVVDRYIIKPTGEGHVDIIAATDNKFENRGLVHTDLVYTGLPQILIDKPAEAKYGDVVYYATETEVAEGTDWSTVNATWVTSADIKGTKAGNYYVYAKVEETAEFNGIEPTLLYAPTDVEPAEGPAVIAKFDLSKVDEQDAAKYKPTGNAWAYDGTAHNIALEPAAKSDMADLTVLYATAFDAADAAWKAVDNFTATKNADPKTVFWKIVGNDNIVATAADAENKVEATIRKAQVTLALADGLTTISGIKASYYYKGGAEIAIGTPGGVVVTKTPNVPGGELKYFVEKKSEEIYVPVTENKVKELGKYRVNAKFVGNDDVATVESLTDAQCATFEVVRPTVAINTTATPGVVGIGAVPTCGWTAKWDDADHLDDVVAPANVTYTYWRYYRPSHNQPRGWYQVQPSSFQAGQTIQVRVNVSDFTTKKGNENGYTDVVEGTWATFTVAGTQILAEILPGTFTYGEILPLTIKYVSGFGEGEDAADKIEAFNEASRSGFMKAKMIKDAEGNEVTNGTEYTLTGDRKPTYMGRQYMTTLLPVGTYRVSANFGTNTQQIITKTAEWTIEPKDLNNADVTYDADGNADKFEVWGIGTSKIDNDEFDLSLTYRGAQIVPTVAEVGGVNGGLGINYRWSRLTDADYEIVGPTAATANIDAGEGTFTVVGKGNFTGTVPLTFTIAKKDVTAYPKQPATWQIGTTPNFKVDYDRIYTQLVGRDLKDDDGDSEFDVETAEGFKDIQVRRLANVTVGTYPDGIEAYLAEGKAAKNYNILPGTGDVTITKGEIKLKLDNVTAVYNGKGEMKPAYDFVLDDETKKNMDPVLLDNDNWKTLIGTPGNPTWTEEDGWKNIEFKLDAPKTADDGRYTVANTYGIQYDPNATSLSDGKKNKELMTSTNYDITVTGTEATLSITKAPITVTVLNQTGVDVDHVRTDLVLLTEETGFNATIKAEPGLKAGDNLSMLFGTNKITVEDNRVLNLAKNQTGFGVNYDVKVVPGNLNVEAYPLLELPSDGTDAAKIAANDNKPYQYIKVTIKPSRMKVNGENNYFDWKEDKWHAMVLPFAASVSQISRAFSFAIVNVVDLDNTKEDHIAFMLPSATATVPANTPFMLKTSKDININGKAYTATFSPKDEDELEEGEVNFYTIKAPKAENTYELPQTDSDPVSQVFIDADDLNLGYKFAGTYDQIIIDKNLSYLRFLNDNNVWSKVGSASTAKFYMAPYAGYINRGEANGTREFIVTFEEEDGSTTAIKDINFEGGNKVSAEGLYRVDGIKVQGATTQKGVYIQDGKKFVK